MYNGKYPNTISIAIVVCKIDLTDIPIEELLRRLPEFLERLQRNGIGFYCIDCTRDFCICLDRKALLDHLVSEHDFLQQKVPKTTRIVFWRTTRMWATNTRPVNRYKRASSTTRFHARSSVQASEKIWETPWPTTASATTRGSTRRSPTRTYKRVGSVASRCRCTRYDRRRRAWKQQKRLSRTYILCRRAIHCSGRNLYVNNVRRQSRLYTATWYTYRSRQTFYAVYWGHTTTGRIFGVSQDYTDREFEIQEKVYLSL